MYVAPSDYHLRLERGVLRVTKGDPVSYQCPSGTVLFQSMAKNLGKNGLGVLLTGMGEDGAEGLLEMRQSGAYTLAENESSAVVYGMPGSAVKLGAVCESLSLQDLIERLLTLTLHEKEL